MNNRHIILVRHGLTEYNTEDLRLGSSDIPLNAAGQAQAQAIAAFLQAYPIHTIYHSDMLRTTETAQVIAETLGCPMKADSRFRERDHGTFEGTPRELSNGVDTTSLLSPEEMAAHGVESLDTTRERVIAAYSEIRLQTAEQEGAIVIVSHFAPIRLLLAHTLSLGVDGRKYFDITPGSISILNPHSGYDQISLLNFIPVTATATINS